MEVIERVERTERNIGGLILPVTITRRVGLDQYIDSEGKTFLADEATFMDFGPKLGVQRTYVLHPENPPTEEEREIGRERLRQTVIRALTEQRLWDKVGRPA